DSFDIKLVDFISNVRIEQAIFYIETTCLSITEISHKCGFGSLRNFNRIFKDRVGVTPSEYKRHL
ncbi:MAG: helix-turn-helix transcriptional regulator, partial [Clostridia bacterium]|nr:helix-turn-helix transcriptional regulator [Clostridia bacterium]